MRTTPSQPLRGLGCVTAGRACDACVLRDVTLPRLLENRRQRPGVTDVFGVRGGVKGSRRDAADGRSGIDVFCNNSTGANASVVAYLNIIHNTDSGADVDIVANMSGIPDIRANGSKLPHGYIVGYHRFTVYHQTTGMLNVHTVSNNGFWGNKQAVFPFVSVCHPARQGIKPALTVL